jgi:hypothetical protein
MLELNSVGYLFIRDKPIFFSETMLCEDYDCMGSVEKISCREPQGAWRQDDLIDSKPPVVK